MSTLNLLTILLLATLGVSLIFRQIRLPAILGYIVVGIFIGPYILNWLQNDQVVHDIAEFGIVFLMFTIGLEFSFRQLRQMRRILLGYGGLQVLISTVVTIFIAQWLMVSTPASIIIGGVVAMSSTAIVLKQLTEQTELNSPHGINAVGILLLQDLAFILFLVLLPKLSSTEQNLIYIDLAIAVARSIFLIVVLVLIGRFIMRPLFKKTAATSSPEIFTLMTLAAAMSFAWMSHYLGLSLSLGAFLAGMMLSESQFRHQVKIEIRPFRDVLLGLFFITIGMQLNIDLMITAWHWVALLITALFVFKISLITGLGLLFKSNISTALRTGLILAQGGEFGLVLLLEGLKNNLLPTDYGQVILGAILISMILSPFVINFNQRIAAMLLPKNTSDTEKSLAEAKRLSEHLTEHAIICGFGRVGQRIVTLLENESLPYVAIDLDAERVNQAIAVGKKVVYGDACQLNMLRHVGIARAKCIAICLDNPETNTKLLQQIQYIHPHITVLVRSQSGDEIESYTRYGASEVIPEILESSLILGSHLLLYMGISATKVFTDLESARHHRYALFRHIFPGSQAYEVTQHIEADKQLSKIRIEEKSNFLGHCLADIQDDTDVTFIALRRDGINLPEKNMLNTPLQKNDALVVYGTQDQITHIKIHIQGHKVD